MKVIKLIGIAVVTVVVIVGAIATYTYMNLNAIVKQTVESEGPKMTQTHVSLANVDVSLPEGRVRLQQFVIGNPKGFSEKNILSADDIVVEIEPKSLGQDVIVLKAIHIKGVVITAEQKGLKTNVEALLNTLKNVGGPATDQPAASETESSSKEPRFYLENLQFSQNNVALVTEKYGDYDIPLPSFSAKNIGDRSVGLTGAELGKAIARPLLKRAKDALEQRLKDKAKEALKDKAEDTLKRKAKEKLGDDVEEKIDALKSLFK